LSLIIIILLGFFSKKFYFNKWLGYESIPNTYIFDEHDYPFVGYSFRKTGVPTGWSILNVYQELSSLNNKNINYSFNGTSITANEINPNLKNKNIFNYPATTVIDVDIGKGTETIRIVQPFFDHPIFGSWLYSLGTKTASSFNDFKPSDYRKIALILSVATGFLIFLFSYLLFSNLFISFIAFFIYSTVPEFILMSRFSLFENILIPLSLLSFSTILLSHKQKKGYLGSILIFFSGLISALAFLTKVSGVFIILTCLILLVRQKANVKKILLYLTPITILTLIYYGYMYYLSPQLFLKLLFDQANRGWFGPLSFFYQIIQPNFSGFPKSGFWLFGLISLFSLFIKNNKKYLNLFIPFIVYMLVFLFVGGSNYPWYYLPFLPFIIIASAVVVYQVFTKPNLANLLIFYLLIFSSSFYWGYFVFHENQNNNLIFRISLITFTAMFLIKKYKFTKYSKIIWYLFFCVVLYQIYQWNNQGFQYIISNWNRLPIEFSFPI